MKKRRIVCGILASSVVLAAFGGCSLVSTNTAADMNQVIADVDISGVVGEDLKAYKDAVGQASVIKRELITYYINYGYMYVQGNGNSPKEVFTMLLESLVENAIVVQYSTMYLLKDKATNPDSILGYDANAVSEYSAKENEAKKYEYLLGEEDVKIAEYNLCKTINSSIDSKEKEELDDDEKTEGDETRDEPKGVDEENEDYYPKKDDGSLDYAIYTGYQDYTLEASGAYQKDKLEGTTRSTRITAYNKFISGLSSDAYDLVDSKTENMRDVRKLKYVETEYVNQLKQRIIDRYFDIYEDEQEKLLKELDKDPAKQYALLQAHYDSLLHSQTNSFKDESSFSSAMDEMSDESFILYAPKADDGGSGKFGFVYNILLPFDDKQGDALKELQSIYEDKDLDGGYKPEYFVERKALLDKIQTTDQREAWFNGKEDRSFNAKDSNLKYFRKGDASKGSDWLFFENNVSRSDRYKPLEKYAGLYPYNGLVLEKKDDYLLVPNKLNVDQMLTEFEDYVKFVSGVTATTVKNPDYTNLTVDNLYKSTLVNGKKEIDYSKLVYATGKVNFTEDEAFNRSNMFVKDSAQYKALSAVNELQYAYTTDTGILSKYIGYTVQAGDTSYIKEFEYAAHKAINESGAGGYAVCAGDFGWHLIYVTYTFDGDATDGKQYTPDWANNVEKEGTFENMFFEWFKDGKLSDLSNTRRSKIVTTYKSDDTVTKYQQRYQNLLDMKTSN